MNPYYTLIVKMPCGQYTVGRSTNIDYFLEACRKKSNRGYFHQKRNIGRARIVFLVKGDYVRSIKCFGGKKFMSMMKNYDPLNDALYQVLT